MSSDITQGVHNGYKTKSSTTPNISTFLVGTYYFSIVLFVNIVT